MGWGGKVGGHPKLEHVLVRGRRIRHIPHSPAYRRLVLGVRVRVWGRRGRKRCKLVCMTVGERQGPRWFVERHASMKSKVKLLQGRELVQRAEDGSA